MKPNWVATTNFKYDYYSLSSVFDAYTSEMPKVVGFPFNYRFENGLIWYDENNFVRHEQQLKEHPGQVAAQLRFIKTESKDLIAAARRYGMQSSLSAFRSWHRAFLSFLPTLGIVIALERVLAERLKKFLSEAEFLDVSFAKETATAGEQRALFEIASRYRKGRARERAVGKHLQKYGWVGNKLMSWQPITRAQIEERLAEIGNAGRQKRREFDENRRAMERRLKEIERKLSAPGRRAVAQYRDLLYWRSGRAEALMLACELTVPLFLWLGERYHLSRPEVTRFSAAELVRIAAGKMVPSPERRTKFYAWMVNGRVIVRWGSEGRVVARRKSSILEFAGVPANRGIVKGRVAVVIDPKDLRKVRKGDVLVAYGTNPSMVVAMEKSSAFVTDTGSLTSHTAIIARELNLPAVVATRIATEVLRDGDVVQVDGGSGVVRILKRAKR